MEMQKLIVLAGPTAVGKTGLSIALAKKIGGEIISADSVQVYRGLDIGSAKIRKEEMQGVSHYLIDVLDPEESFDVVRFQSLAGDAMRTIRSHGHIPILVGGTGFYIQSVVYGIDFTENDSDTAYRKKLEQIADPEVLHAMLEKVDPDSASAIHPNNIRRTIRALEFYHQTGEPISRHNRTERERSSPYRFCYFVLNEDRRKVYERIDRRVDRMLEDGLEGEVRGLLQRGVNPDANGMQALGYAQMCSYIAGEIPYEEAVRLIKRDTRHFAKRQITWFKREKEVVWIDRGKYGCDDDRILDAMIQILAEKGIVPSLTSNGNERQHEDGHAGKSEDGK